MAPYTPVLIRTICLYHAHTYPFSHVSLLPRTLESLERHWLFLSCWTNRSFSCSHDRRGTGHRVDTLTCKPSGKSAVLSEAPLPQACPLPFCPSVGGLVMDGYVLPALRCSTFASYDSEARYHPTFTAFLVNEQHNSKVLFSPACHDAVSAQTYPSNSLERI